MPGEWDEALRLLLPAMSEADAAAQAQQSREQWLRSLLPESVQYGHKINDAVSYFLNTVLSLRPDVAADMMAKKAVNFKTVRGPVIARGINGVGGGWDVLIDYREWPEVPSGGSFRVQTDGRWYFGYTDYYRLPLPS